LLRWLIRESGFISGSRCGITPMPHGSSPMAGRSADPDRAGLPGEPRDPLLLERLGPTVLAQTQRRTLQHRLQSAAGEQRLACRLLGPAASDAPGRLAFGPITSGTARSPGRRRSAPPAATTAKAPCR